MNGLTNHIYSLIEIYIQLLFDIYYPCMNIYIFSCMSLYILVRNQNSSKINYFNCKTYFIRVKNKYNLNLIIKRYAKLIDVILYSYIPSLMKLY